MNTTETTVTTKSIRTLAGEYIAAQREAVEATKAADFLHKSLDAAPKTPTGKDTKSTKNARDHVNAETSKFNLKSSEAYEAFTSAIEKHAEAYTNAVTSFYNVKNVLADLNYTYLESTTEQVRESTKAIHEHNQKVETTRKDLIYFQYVGNRDYVFANLKGSHVVIRVRAYSVTVTYIGDGPVETKHGLAFLDNQNAIRSFNGFSHGTGTVNLSAIGDEEFDSVEHRLKNTLEGICIQRHIDKKIPIADCNDVYSFRVRHIRDVCGLASFIVSEPESNFGFRVDENNKIEACAFLPQIADKSIVYGTDANDA